MMPMGLSSSTVRCRWARRRAEAGMAVMVAFVCLAVLAILAAASGRTLTHLRESLRQHENRQMERRWLGGQVEAGTRESGTGLTNEASATVEGTADAAPLPDRAP